MNESKMYSVTIGGITRQYAAGTPYGEIVEPYQKDSKDDIILVKVNSRLRELHKTLKFDCNLSFVTTGDQVGFNAYRRSVVLMLLKAFYHEAGRENVDKLILNHSYGSGYFFTCKGRVTLDGALIDRVKAYMDELVKKKLPIKKRSIDTDEAIELFGQYRMYDKEKLFRFRRVSKVNIYNLDDFEDYFYGFMAWHTGMLKYYDIFLYENGFILNFPSMKNTRKIEPFKQSPKVFKVQQESEKWGDSIGVSTVGELNEKIASESMRDIILASEAQQEGKISEIADGICKKDGVKFVMVAGPSSSGKTTFSNRLAVQLLAHGAKPHLISADNYFVNRENTPRDENGNYNYECLEALDIKQLNEDLCDLLEGREVNMPSYNFKTGVREYQDDRLILGAEDILIIEGIHCLNDAFSYELPKDSKFKIYISALTQLNIDEHNHISSTDGRLLRRIVRDAHTRGSSAKNTIHMWDSVRKGENENIFPYQESADVMFNSALLYEFSVLKLYAEPALFQIEKTDEEYQEAKRLLKFLDYFLPLPGEEIPINSLLREFIGGGCFKI